MAANLANPETGSAGVVLSSSPNGTETSTLATFNALANVVAGCVADADNCAKLFAATTPPGGSPPRNVLQALANLVRNPAYPGYPSDAEDPVFMLSHASVVHQPALTQRPTSWLLFLKITGAFNNAQDSDNLINGPGNFAIDEQGFVWANDNAEPRPPHEFACAGRRLLKFYPWGETFPGSPYFGGGLSGAGYGITLDPEATYGSPISDSRIRPARSTPNWPRRTTASRSSRRTARRPPPTTPDSPTATSFSRRARCPTNNRSSTVSVLSPGGRLLETLPAVFDGRTVLSHPVGNAADIEGNIWVANSDWLDSPCPTRTDLGPATNPSITLYDMKSRTPHPGSPFTGGGLTSAAFAASRLATALPA